MAKRQPETELRIALQLYARRRHGARLFRNHNGVIVAGDRKFRVGLGKGSSDLIGWTTCEGNAIFTAIEIKRPGQRPTTAQAAFIEAVLHAGGFAGTASSTDDIDDILEF